MPEDSKQQENPILERALLAINDVANFVQLGWTGLHNALGLPEMIVLLRNSHRRETREMYRGVELLENAEKLRDFAKKQQENDFTYLHGMAVVRLWTILEALVEDVAIDRLTDPEKARTFADVRELEGPLLGFAAADSGERASILLELLLLKLHTKLGRGIGRFEQLLQAVRLGGPVNPVVRRVLLELSAVRNVIVHRNGEVDARFAEICPWLQAKVGEPLIIPRSRVGRYVSASIWYVLELSRRYECEPPNASAADQSYLERLVYTQTKVLSRIDDSPNP